MSRCNQCNIEVLDETERCPLCHSVLEKTVDVENMYPDIRMKSRKMVLFSRIYLFIAVTIEIILINICIFLDAKIVISIISGCILFYGYMVIRYAIIGQSGYREKILVLTTLAILIFIAIDYFSGYRGWSVNYIFPSGILLIDVGVVILIGVNRKNWQSYIMMELFMVICSIGGLILKLTGIITDPVLIIIATNVSAILFLGTVIIGGRRAKVELKRRFHIR